MFYYKNTKYPYKLNSKPISLVVLCERVSDIGEECRVRVVECMVLREICRGEWEDEVWCLGRYVGVSGRRRRYGA